MQFIGDIYAAKRLSGRPVISLEFFPPKTAEGDKALLEKPRLVVANKIDLESAAANLAKFRRRYKVDIAKISCVSGEGLDELKELLYKRVRAHRPAPKRKAKPAS